jgi:hypothetical protein
MSNNNNRVLGRVGARQLSQNETDGVSAGVSTSLLSVIRTGTPISQDFRLDE